MGVWAFVGLAILGAACNIQSLENCYVQVQSTLTGSGSISFVSPASSTMAPVSFGPLSDDSTVGPIGYLALAVTQGSDAPRPPPTTPACRTELAATLTFSASDASGATTFSGMVSFDYQQPVEAVSCTD
jgi:hypothetical protein